MNSCGFVIPNEVSVSLANMSSVYIPFVIPNEVSVSLASWKNRHTFMPGSTAQRQIRPLTTTITS